MRSLALRGVVAVLGATLLLTGCSENEDPTANRAPGDAISEEEAQVLADVLNRNFIRGGADVRITAPYSPEATLTLTGEIDFTTGEGTLDSLTVFSDGQPDEVRTVFFTSDRILVGNLPGFAAAMGEAGRPDAVYLRTGLDGGGRLIDNIIGMLQRLAAPEPDDPDNLVAAGYTWQGGGRIDSTLISTFATGSGTARISIGAADHLLRQFVSPPPGGDFPVSINLTAHGTRSIDFPSEEQIADASAYPEVAAQFGF